MSGDCTPPGREIIVISDDETEAQVPKEEVVFRDIYEVPPVVPPAAGQVPAYRSDEEGPAFDWDAVAAAYDAAVRADEEPGEEYDDMMTEDSPATVRGSDEEDHMVGYSPDIAHGDGDSEEEPVEGDDMMTDHSPESVPEGAPHPAHDSDTVRVVGAVRSAAAQVAAARQETFEARMAAAAQAQAAAEELHALEGMMDTRTEEEAQVRVQLTEQLAVERGRTARLRESLEIARAVAQRAEARMAQQHEEVASALRDLSRLVAGFTPTPGQPAHLIRRDTVLRLITAATCRALPRP